MLVLQGAVQETYLCLTQEESSMGGALRVSAKPLAHAIQKARGLDVCKVPVTIPPEVNEMCWPNYTSHNNILPILILFALHDDIHHLIS